MDSRALHLDVAVDTGGTFTDVVGRRSDGQIKVLKVPSTPDDPGRAVLQGIAELQKVLPGVLRHVAHGTTVATNGLLEAKGSRAVFITTKGFEDLLLLRRQNRPSIYELCPTPPQALIPRDRTLGIKGRINHHGAIIEPLESIEAFIAANKNVLNSAESVAVCLLYGHVNAAHETAVGQALRASYPDKHITLASELSPLSREYERAETVAANAFIGPIMSDYLGKLALDLEPAALTVMDSSGGRLPVSEAIDSPVKTALSGPAGGVRGAWAAGCDAGFTDVLGLDIGGTSTDVSIAQGDLFPQVDGCVGHIPLRTPMLPIETVGAGGGSIASIDDGGALRVGPESAGALPGPAAYGRAGPGAAATLTDANVVLGRITHLLGGSMALDRKAAEDAVQRLADRLGAELKETARAIIAIAESTMVRACKNICMDQGVDPRKLALVAFGGAGGLHGCAVAQELGISTLIFPPDSGVLSAIGIQSSPLEYARSYARYTHSNDFDSEKFLQEVEEKLGQACSRSPELHREIEIYFDCRLEGQSHDMAIPVTQLLAGDLATIHVVDELRRIDRPGGLVDALGEALASRHETLYGWRPQSNEAFELTSYRIHVRNHAGRVGLTSPSQTTVSHQGPAVVSRYSATLWLPHGWTATELSNGTIVCKLTSKTSRKVDASASKLGLEVHRQRLTSIAEEMGAALMRSSYSANIKERRDYSCALFDGSGNLLIQAAHIPVHLGSQEMSVKAAIDNIEFSPGDTVILNDPFCGGTHLPDVTLVSPVFIDHGSKPAFFVANRAHHADIGGISPGSMPAPFTEDGSTRTLTIYDEGFRIRPTLLDDSVRASFIESSRTPHERSGDLRAQEAANHVGKERLRELAADIGSADLMAELNSQLLAYAEARMRSIIRSIPNGVHEFTDALDSDGIHDTPLNIHVKLEILDDEARVDFSKSADSCETPLNAVRAITLAATYYAFRCLAPEELPSSGGIMRPIQVITRPGSICDASYPSAVSSGNVETSQRLVDALLGALSFFKPLEIPAASCGSMNNVLIGGQVPDNPAKSWVHYETLAGGCGGSPSASGASALHVHMTNTLNTPVEEIERLFPVQMIRYAIRPVHDEMSMHPGGSGIERAYKFLHGTTVTLMTERRILAPYGLQGGQDGEKGVNVLVRGDGSRLELPGKISCQAQAGDTLVIKTPGGGGWGAPDKA